MENNYKSICNMRTFRGIKWYLIAKLELKEDTNKYNIRIWAIEKLVEERRGKKLTKIN